MIEVGVDIGGTFTDVVFRMPGHPLRVMKVPSTREDPGRAVLGAIATLQRDWNVDPATIVRFVHGTTVATNAVLERSGPKIGLLTTEGFADILEIGRQMRHTMYAAVLQPEEPVHLAPGAFRHEIAERVAADGTVIRPLDEESVRRAVRQLVADGARGVAICFLFAFANSEHERRAAEIVREIGPHLAISLSSEVDPAFREYERTVVTLFDAYIKPVIDTYLARLELELARAGVSAPLQIMQSRGGISSSVVARERPVRLFLSGPAAGVVGAHRIGGAAAAADLISVDVGGTSSDIALIRAGKPLVRPEGLVGGYNIRVPMVDVNAIGAGGGSVAWLDDAGGLRVGPQSAGSEPGPACYDRGGDRATVTDASVVLGYLDPQYFAGGTFPLAPQRAWDVIERTIAAPLGLTVREAALGIHRVVNAQMVEGIRLVSIRQGYDPRDFALLPLGGAGGIHACALAEELDISRIVIAPHPGVLSAIGLLSAPIEHEVSMAFSMPLHSGDQVAIERTLDVLDAGCERLMAMEAIAGLAIRREYFADLCYIGQSHQLEVPLCRGPDLLTLLGQGFRETHRRVFGHGVDAPITIVNLRAIHRAGGDAVADVTDALEERSRHPKGEREIRIAGHKPLVAAVYDRTMLRSGDEITGPVILEQPDTTTLVGPDWQVRALPSGTIELVRARVGR